MLLSLYDSGGVSNPFIFCSQLLEYELAPSFHNEISSWVIYIACNLSSSSMQLSVYASSGEYCIPEDDESIE